MNSTRRFASFATITVLALSACGGGSSPDSTSDEPVTTSATTAASTAPAATDTSLPQRPATTPPVDTVAVDTVAVDTVAASTAPDGTEAGLDDVDGDGELDPTCGTVDLGDDLVVRVLCTSMAPENEDGVLPVEPGPLSLAGMSFPETDEVDATVRWGRSAAGERVTIFQLGSDTLFDAGSSAVRSTAAPALAGVAAAITAHLTDGRVVVRGHADSRGSATDNQSLSSARADAVAASLVALGIDPNVLSTVGLGSSVPAALEVTADGSVSEIGQTLNRRVEIVVIRPA